MELPIGAVGTASTEKVMGTTCLSRGQFVQEVLHPGAVVIASRGTKYLFDFVVNQLQTIPRFDCIFYFHRSNVL